MAEGKVIKLIPEEITEAPDDTIIQIVTRVFETQDEFIFETIRPFCETQAHMAITKDKLIRALTLLKEQEPVKPKKEDAWPSMITVCGACGANIPTPGGWRYNYCPTCGRGIKWDADGD